MFKMALSSFLLLLVLFAGMTSTKHIPCKVECERKPKTQYFGIDIAKKPIYIDVGECHTILLNRTQEGCNTNTEHTCIKRCIPRSHEFQEASNRDGPIRVAVIRSCYPTYHHCLDGCELKPRILYLFPESKYQTRVDIRKCSGQCSEASDHSCVPTSVRTTSVDGPNGPLTLSVIDKCECRYSVCYRQDYYQSHWNYSMCDNNVTKTKTEKVINVGKCIGTCAGVELPGRCYPSRSRCLLYIPSGPAKCVPTTFSTESYYDSDMNKVQVSAIEKCGCASG